MVISRAVLSGIAALTVAAAASAALAQKAITITIDDPRWLAMTKSEQDALIGQLKAAGALGKYDTVIYVAPKSDRPSEKNVDAIKTMRSLAGLICRRKSNAVEEECGALTGAERTSCREANKHRVQMARGVCR